MQISTRMVAKHGKLMIREFWAPQGEDLQVAKIGQHANVVVMNRRNRQLKMLELTEPLDVTDTPVIQ